MVRKKETKLFTASSCVTLIRGGARKQMWHTRYVLISYVLSLKSE